MLTCADGDEVISDNGNGRVDKPGHGDPGW